MESTSFTLIGAGFVLVTVVFYAWFYRVLRSAIARTSWTDDRKRTIANRFLSMAIGWSVLVLAVSTTGFYSDFSMFPPRFMLAILPPLVVIIIVVFSRPVTELLPYLPARDLLNIQVFRVFVELLLWATVLTGLAPEQVSFEGRNFDVLSGIFGPIVGVFFVNSRLAVRLYNIIALGLLINIVCVAFLSLPTPFRMFLEEPSTMVVSMFPFVILPSMLVPLAYGLSFLSLRQLALTK